MAEYIDKGKLEQAMYRKAFIDDSDLTKWDGGCWIRYKLFENVVKSIPTIDAVPVVRCKNCLHSKLNKMDNQSYICKISGGLFAENFYCASGRKREEL